MRHGSALALVAACWSLVCLGPIIARVDAGSGAAEGWVLPDASQGRRVTPILLLSRPDVQADLRMKPEQVADAARIIANLHHKAKLLQGRTDQAAIELRRAVDEEQRLWLETKLTEDQVGRLTEIDLRWEGLASIVTRPALAESLALSDDQKETLKRAAFERIGIRHQPAEADQTMLERRLAQKVMATLNEGQRKRWASMVGRPFTVVATGSNGGLMTR